MALTWRLHGVPALVKPAQRTTAGEEDPEAFGDGDRGRFCDALRGIAVLGPALGRGGESSRPVKSITPDAFGVSSTDLLFFFVTAAYRGAEMGMVTFFSFCFDGDGLAAAAGEEALLLGLPTLELEEATGCRGGGVVTVLDSTALLATGCRGGGGPGNAAIAGYGRRRPPGSLCVLGLGLGWLCWGREGCPANGLGRLTNTLGSPANMAVGALDG